MNKPAEAVTPTLEVATDLLGAGMARTFGAAARVLEDRIAALERQLDVAEQPHTRRCTQVWDTCTCGLRELMSAEPLAALSATPADPTQPCDCDPIPHDRREHILSATPAEPEETTQ